MGSQNSFLVFIVILVLIVAIRIRRVLYGTRVSTARTIGYSAYYILFAGIFVALSYFESVPLEYFALYTVVLFGAAILSYNLARSRLEFWKGSDGSLYSKGGTAIYLIYLAGLIARIAIGYLFLGSSFLTFAIISLSPQQEAATIITDLLLVLGAGLLVGRNMQILRRSRAISRGEEKLGTMDKKVKEDD